MKRLTAALCLLACSGAPPLARVAHAGGLYVTDRGVRPLGRGGAFVAGADDLGAVWYNPAGIVDAGSAVLVDFSWLNFNANYTQKLYLTNPDGTIQEPSEPGVHGTAPFLPLPTIVGSYAFGSKKQFVVAAGVLAPYVALTTYPTTVTNAEGQQVPSPARYAAGSFSGSVMVIPGIWFAWKPVPQLRLGVGLMALAGSFGTTVTFSTSIAQGALAPQQDPSYDAAAQLTASPIFAPAATAGIIYAPIEEIRFGVSGQGPMTIDAPAMLQMRLPSASIYDGAYQNGTSAHIHFVLPAIFRAGIEVRPAKGLRIEAAYVREFWSEEQTIDIHINNISLNNVSAGLLSNQILLPNIQFPRNFQDSNSYRLGGEYHYSIGGYPVDTRLGVSYETSAVPVDWLSISSLDFNKVIASIGGSLYIGAHWRFDATYAHVFEMTTYVDPAIAKLQPENPISGNPSNNPINGGTYSAEADVVGVGMNYKF